jgi:hypothetical protein
MTIAPDIWTTLAELDGGTVEAQFRHAAIAVAKSMRDHDGKGQGRLILDLKFERTKGSGQLLIASKVSVARPTETGKASEESNAETLIYVHTNGHMSILPEEQMRFEFNSKEA